MVRDWDRKKIIFIGLIIVLLVTAIPTSVYAYNNYNYNQALNLAEASLKKENFDDAIKNYNLSVKYKKETAFIEAKIDKAKKLQSCKVNFNNATHLWGQKEYVKALQAYCRVNLIDSKYYRKSQQIISQYITDNLNLAKQQASKSNYSEAIKSVNLILDFDSSNNEAKMLKSQFQKRLSEIQEEQKRQEAAKKKAEAEAAAQKKATEGVKKQTTKQTTTNVPKPGSSTTRPIPQIKVISTSGPFSLGLINTYERDYPAIEFIIRGPSDSNGCKVSGIASTDSNQLYLLYQGEIQFSSYQGFVDRGGFPAGQSVKLGFSITYKSKKYDLGGIVKVP